MYDCTAYNRHDRTRPRNLNRENIEDWPSAKIGPHENFPLYYSMHHILLYNYGDIIWLAHNMTCIVLSNGMFTCY
jgi:hypothetical protein